MAGIEVNSISAGELKSAFTGGRVGGVKVRLKSKGIVALLKSAPVANDLRRRAEGMRSRLPTSKGEDWVVDDGYSKDRAWSIVVAKNAAAKAAASEGALHRAIDGGR